MTEVAHHAPRRRRTDALLLESAPLHTERPEIAREAPTQAAAAFARGAHAIGFTEVNPHAKVSGQLQVLAGQHGYAWIHGGGDTALAVQSHLRLLHADPWVQVSGERGFTAATFAFHRSAVTVSCHHFATNVPAHHAVRDDEVKALIDQVHIASHGQGLAFFMGDVNPDGPLKALDSFPRHELDAAGLPLIYEELDTWPPHIGVNVIGRDVRDHRVQASSVNVYPPLGSDHFPVLGAYNIERPLRHPAAV